jgi:Putative Flp pilus-assembly TadE/G-like
VEHPERVHSSGLGDAFKKDKNVTPRGNHVPSSLRRSALFPTTLFNDVSGSIASIFALSLTVLVGVGGLAVDYGLINWKKTKTQEVLDSAVLSGVSGSGSAMELSGVAGGLTNEQRIATAQTYFDASHTRLPAIDNVSFAYEGNELVGRASAHVTSLLLSVIGFPRFDMKIESRATSNQTRGPICFMAMHPTRKHTLELKGSVSIVSPDCNIYGNSDSADDVVDPHTSNNFITAKSVQAIGFGHHYIENISPPLEHAPELIADPLATLTIPAPGPCDHTNMTVPTGVTTLNPGTYCGGLTVSSGGVVTLNPGTYIITGSAFVADDAQIFGDGVTIVLADSNVKLFWTGATLRISAPTSGPLAGIVLTGTRDPVDHTFTNSTVDLHGVIYLVQGSVTWTNTGTAVMQSKWTAWIVDGVSWDGDGTIKYNFDLLSSSVPYPPSLNVIPRPGPPRLVQ